MRNDEGLDSAPDTELAERFWKGDTRAFETLCDRYYRYVWKCCWKVAQSRADADELTQETFWRAARKMDRFLGNRDNRNFKAWIGRMAISLAINHTRLKKNRPNVSLGEWHDVQAPEKSDPVQVLQDEEYRQALRKATDELPEPMRTYFRESCFLGLPATEIARIHAVPAHQVRDYVRRASEIIQNKLRKFFDDDRLGK